MKKTLITIYEPTKRFQSCTICGNSFKFPPPNKEYRHIVCNTDEKSVHVNNLIRDGYYNSDTLEPK